MKREKVQAVAFLLIFAAAVQGCGSSEEASGAALNDAAYDTAADYGYEYASYSAEAGYTDDAVVTESYEEGSSAKALTEEKDVSSGRKLIKTVDMSVETVSYDELVQSLSERIQSLGGYIEYQYEYNGRLYSTDYEESRSANWEIRIPEAKLTEFLDTVGQESNIVNRTEQVTDVTLQYTDLESHKSALLTEQKRLLEILEKAETVEDIITIEQRLSEVRYQLESMESQLRVLDNQIDYSTVNLNIQEVKRTVKVETNSAWTKIKNGFMESVYNLGDGLVSLLIWIAVNFPYLVLLLIAVIIIIVVKKKLKKKKRRKEKRGASASDEKTAAIGTNEKGALDKEEQV